MSHTELGQNTDTETSI